MEKKNGIAYDFKKGTSNKEVAVVFVPGSGCTRRIFDEIVELMEFDCYAIDLPGHGNSEATGYSYENYVNSVAEFVSDLKNVIIVGHSLGGTICIGVAAKNIPSVKGCVLISCGASYPKLNKDFMKGVHEGNPDPDYVFKAAGGSEDVVKKAMLAFDSRLDVLLKDFLIDEVVNVEERLEQIKVPTQIFAGDEEILALVEYSEFIHKKIKNSKLIIYPGQKHLLFLNAKDKTVEIINELVEIVK
ncbi:MAG: alpha/beta fold hydrolase [Clostridium sp.]